MIKSRQISQRSGNPVYFVKNDKSKAERHVIELTLNARELNLSPSPFYSPKSARKLIQCVGDNLWQDEWDHNGGSHLPEIWLFGDGQLGGGGPPSPNVRMVTYSVNRSAYL